MSNVNTLVAAIWAKCNADIAALKLKAQQEVDALYAEAKRQRDADKEAKRVTKPAPARPKPKPNTFWSIQLHKGRIADPASFDFEQPLPDDWEELYYG